MLHKRELISRHVLGIINTSFLSLQSLWALTVCWPLPASRCLHISVCFALRSHRGTHNPVSVTDKSLLVRQNSQPSQQTKSCQVIKIQNDLNYAAIFTDTFQKKENVFFRDTESQTGSQRHIRQISSHHVSLFHFLMEASLWEECLNEAG